MTRQYGREDVDYSSFYSKWMKDLAATKTRKQLESMIDLSAKDAETGAAAHLRAIEATSSMSGCSQRRAQTGNVTRAASDRRGAASGALEIYDLFPERTKDYHVLAVAAPAMREALAGVIRAFGKGAMRQREISLRLDSPCVETAIAALASLEASE